MIAQRVVVSWAGRLGVLVTVGIAAAGCSGYALRRPPEPPIDARAWPPVGLAQVCVVRPHWLAGAVTLAVHDNGALVGATRGPSYFCYFAEPGVHQIASEEADAGALEQARLTTVVLTAGGRYWLHQRVHPFGHRVEWVDDRLGERMVRRAGYRIIAGTPDGEPPPPQPAIVRAASASNT